MSDEPPLRPAPARRVDLSVVARVCGVSWWAVRRWVSAGRLEAERTDTGRYRVSLDEVNKVRPDPKKDA